MKAKHKINATTESVPPKAADRKFIQEIIKEIFASGLSVFGIFYLKKGNASISMDENTIVIPKEEAEEFGEYKRMKKVLKAKEDISRLEINADKKGILLSRLRELCDEAKRLNVYAVRVNSAYVRAVKNRLSGSVIRTVCRVGGTGECSYKVACCELKYAFHEKADEAELYLSVSAVKNENDGFFRKLIRRALRTAKTRTVSVRTDFSLLTYEEIRSVYLLCFRLGVRVFVVPLDFSFIENLKRDLSDECVFKTEANDLAQFSSASSAGAMRISTDFADEIASELLSQAADREQITP